MRSIISRPYNPRTTCTSHLLHQAVHHICLRHRDLLASFAFVRCLSVAETIRDKGGEGTEGKWREQDGSWSRVALNPATSPSRRVLKRDLINPSLRPTTATMLARHLAQGTSRWTILATRTTRLFHSTTRRYNLDQKYYDRLQKRAEE
jgi:hypothetical protein